MTWTPERHAAVKARCEAATRGPWEDWFIGGSIDKGNSEIRDGNDTQIALAWGYGQFEGNPDFIAHARTDLPDALAEIERLQAERHRLRLVLITINAISGHRASCPHCVNNRTTSYQALEATT